MYAVPVPLPVHHSCNAWAMNSGLASPPEALVPIHPGLLAILPRLQLVHDCWDLLNNQKEYYLPRGEREPDSAYKRRIDAALPSGFFRDALNMT